MISHFIVRHYLTLQRHSHVKPKPIVISSLVETEKLSDKRKYYDNEDTNERKESVTLRRETTNNENAIHREA